MTEPDGSNAASRIPETRLPSLLVAGGTGSACAESMNKGVKRARKRIVRDLFFIKKMKIKESKIKECRERQVENVAEE